MVDLTLNYRHFASKSYDWIDLSYQKVHRCRKLTDYNRLHGLVESHDFPFEWAVANRTLDDRSDWNVARKVRKVIVVASDVCRRRRGGITHVGNIFVAVVGRRSACRRWVGRGRVAVVAALVIILLKVFRHSAKERCAKSGDEAEWGRNRFQLFGLKSRQADKVRDEIE